MDHTLAERSALGDERVSWPRARKLGRLLPRGDTLADADWRRRHRLLVALVFGHAAVLPLVGLAVGFGLWRSILLGGVVPAVPAAAAAFPGGRRSSSALVALGLLSSSAALVYFSGGYIEAHFHFFAVLAVLWLYESWLPSILGVAYVVLHHGIVGSLAPEAVYRHAAAQADPWLWAGIHGVAVAAFGVLGVTVWKLNEDLRAARERSLDDLERSRLALEVANEELRALDAMKSEFVALASHELRTPLTSILGFASTLRHRWDETSDEERGEFVAVIEREAMRLSRVVGEFLDLSRIESGTLPVRVERFSLREVVAAVAAGRPDVDGDRVRGVTVLADRDHVEQILRNLVENADKYGKPPVTIEAVRNGDHVELRVSDGGRGVETEFVPRLFERFSRSEDSNRGEQGAGLGLAVVHGLARANGGDAWYEQTPGGGACFVVKLPR